MIKEKLLLNHISRTVTDLSFVLFGRKCKLWTKAFLLLNHAVGFGYLMGITVVLDVFLVTRKGIVKESYDAKTNIIIIMK